MHLRNGKSLRALAALASIGLLIAIVVVATSASAGSATLRLPDLFQEPPSDIAIARGAQGPDIYDSCKKTTVVCLSFTSQVDNVGQGPLIVKGKRVKHRHHRMPKAMTAWQLIAETNGKMKKVRHVGEWIYARNPDHQHWHYQDFDRFTLKNRSGKRVANSAKRGFCIGDRSKGATWQDTQLQPQYVQHCGLLKPYARSVSGGMSVGWGDDYQAYLEGESINVTKVHAGTYCLEHRATYKFKEVGRANNTAVAIVDINPQANPPTVNVRGTLSPANSNRPSCAQAFSSLAP